MLLSKSKNIKMEEIRVYLPVSQAASFESVAPHIHNVERDYLIPVIGKELYDKLNDFYKSESGADSGRSEVDELTLELLRLAQSAVVHLAYWIGFDLLNSHITDGGFKRIETDSVKGLYKYQEDNLKSYFRTNGFNQLDTMLQFLEEHIDEFDEWGESESYTLFKSMFISTTEQFNSIVFINSSRLTFLRMKPHLQFIEDTEIAPLLGEVILSKVKDELVKVSPEPRVVKLLPYIRKPLAYLASALLMEESGADLKDNGLYFNSSRAVGMNSTEKQPSSDNRIAILVMRNRNYGNAYLDQLRTYLEKNSDQWPEAVITSGKVFRRDNTGKKTFWQ